MDVIHQKQTSNSQFLNKLKSTLTKNLDNEELHDGSFDPILNDNHSESISAMKPFQKNAWESLRTDIQLANQEILRNKRNMKVTPSKIKSEDVANEKKHGLVNFENDDFSVPLTKTEDFENRIIKDLRLELKRSKENSIEHFKEFQKREKYLIDDRDALIKRMNEELAIRDKKISRLIQEYETIKTERNELIKQNKDLVIEKERYRSDCEKAIESNFKRSQAQIEPDKEEEIDDYLLDSDEDGLAVENTDFISERYNDHSNEEMAHSDLDTQNIMLSTGRLRDFINEHPSRVLASFHP